MQVTEGKESLISGTGEAKEMVAQLGSWLSAGHEFICHDKGAAAADIAWWCVDVPYFTLVWL